MLTFYTHRILFSFYHKLSSIIFITEYLYEKINFERIIQVLFPLMLCFKY